MLDQDDKKLSDDTPEDIVFEAIAKLLHPRELRKYDRGIESKIWLLREASAILLRELELRDDRPLVNSDLTDERLHGQLYLFKDQDPNMAFLYTYQSPDRDLARLQGSYYRSPLEDDELKPIYDALTPLSKPIAELRKVLAIREKDGISKLREKKLLRIKLVHGFYLDLIGGLDHEEELSLHNPKPDQTFYDALDGSLSSDRWPIHISEAQQNQLIALTGPISERWHDNRAFSDRDYEKRWKRVVHIILPKGQEVLINFGTHRSSLTKKNIASEVAAVVLRKPIDNVRTGFGFDDGMTRAEQSLVPRSPESPNTQSKAVDFLRWIRRRLTFRLKDGD